MKRQRARVTWEEGRKLAATVPDESDMFEDYTSEEDDLLRSGKADSPTGEASGPVSPSKPGEPAG